MNDNLQKANEMWRSEFGKAEYINLTAAQSFVNFWRKDVCIEADFANEKIPFHLRPLNKYDLRTRPVLYKEEIFKIAGVC